MLKRVRGEFPEAFDYRVEDQWIGMLSKLLPKQMGQLLCGELMIEPRDRHQDVRSFRWARLREIRYVVKFDEQISEAHPSQMRPHLLLHRVLDCGSIAPVDGGKQRARGADHAVRIDEHQVREIACLRVSAKVAVEVGERQGTSVRG